MMVDSLSTFSKDGHTYEAGVEGQNHYRKDTLPCLEIISRLCEV